MRIYGDGNHQNRSYSAQIEGFRGAIATEHHLSAQAGMDILKQGGNAFDAAAAAALAESVVNPHMFSIGGECPMLLYTADDENVVSVNGNTEAPATAGLEAFKKRVGDLIPAQGVLAAGVPAAFAAIVEMLIRDGTLPFEAIAEPAYNLARDGFPVHEGLLYMPNFAIRDNRDHFLDQWPHSAKLYLNPDGSVPEFGRRIKNPAFADVLNTLMETARQVGVKGRAAGLKAALDVFYQGDIAAEIAKFVKQREGFLTRQDLAQFRTRFEKPVSATFKDATVFKCGPWSQGPVFLQILKILEGFDMDNLQHNSADYLHLWIEATKLAFADREQYYADPDFVSVPMTELLSSEYNAKRRQLIDRQKASGFHRPGDPLGGDALLAADQVFQWESWGFGTVHVAVVDGNYNMAALTPSGGWMSGNEVIPSLGFPLTTRLQTFILDARHPNAPAPGKRPRTTLSPSIAFLRGRPWMAFGTMGGDQQDQWTSQFFLNCVLYGMSVQEAIEAPKVTSDHMPATFYPHDAFPRHVSAEARIAATVIEQLRQRGHKLHTESDWFCGFICAVAIDETGLLQAGADPRGHKSCIFPSCALAW